MYTFCTKPEINTRRHWNSSREKSLLGILDADVLLHAICDAILGLLRLET